jgi:CRP/FNR family cyclic AMP-dependent transcriptional regulator
VSNRMRHSQGSEGRGRPDPGPTGSGHLEMVRVLAEDPGLARHLSGRALVQATSEAIAPLVRLQAGTRSFLLEEPQTHGHLGLLVLDGLLARHATFGHITATELLGPCDLARPWAPPREHGEFIEVRWEALAPTRLAALDRDFANRVRPWPEIAAALLDRTAQLADSHLLLSALRQARRVEDRVLLALWHFAGRWGELHPEGRTLRLSNISGETLAGVVGARRQSVSTALGQLADSGAIKRHPGGSVTIAAQPSELQHVQSQQQALSEHPKRRAGDRSIPVS